MEPGVRVEGSSARPRRAWRAAGVLLGLGLTLLHVATFESDAIGGATYLAVTVGASAAAWVGALRSSRRRTAVLIALGVSLSAAGDVAYSLLLWTSGVAPDVSLADAGWVGAYVAVGAGLLRLMRRGAARMDIDGLIDAAVVIVVVMTLQWELSLDELVSDGSVPALTRAVWMLYPTLDSVLLALVLRATIARRLHGAAGLLMAGGAGCWFAADFAYTLFAPSGAFSAWLDAGWLGGAMLLAAATWHDRSPAPDEQEVTDEGLARVGRTRVAIALLPLLVPGSIELVGHLRGSSPNPVPLFIASGTLVGLALARGFRLLKAETASRQRVRSQERQALALARNSSDAVVVLSSEGRILNEAAGLAALVGYPDVDVRGMGTTTLLAPVNIEDVTATFIRALKAPGETFEAEAKVIHRDGHEMWLSARIVSLLDDPDVGGVVVNLHDVTERRAVQEELVHQAFHDALTGLANRALFSDRVQQALGRTLRSDLRAAVIFLDIDGFKTVNDSLGHGPGDELLREVGRRLLAAVRSTDTVARIGGDEFAILIDQSPRPLDEAEAVAERILASLRTPVVLGEHAVTVTASLGIAVGGPDETAASLLRDSDIAMYRAKTSGKARWTVYNPEMRTAAIERLQLETDLVAALDDGQFGLVYQPVVELETERIVGFEALLRWHHPTLGTITPDRFIPIAEENGLIVPIGKWVLDQACATAARWHRDHNADMSMAINISARQIACPDLLVHVAEALATTGVDPRKIILEMTETALVADPFTAASRLHELRGLGVRLAIDDFGTGYSSLSYLRQFPVDILKIDRSFINSISDRDKVPAIVRGLLDLGRTLELETIAEGVELGVQRDRLRDEHCGFAQGYLFARPLEVADAEMLLMQLGPVPSEQPAVTSTAG